MCVGGGKRRWGRWGLLENWGVERFRGEREWGKVGREGVGTRWAEEERVDGLQSMKEERIGVEDHCNEVNVKQTVMALQEREKKPTRPNKARTAHPRLVPAFIIAPAVKTHFCQRAPSLSSISLTDDLTLGSPSRIHCPASLIPYPTLQSTAFLLWRSSTFLKGYHKSPLSPVFNLATPSILAQVPLKKSGKRPP